MKIKDFLPYILILGLFLYIFFQTSGKDTNSSNSEVKIDSILRVFETKMLKGQFKQTSPQPIINIYPSNNPSKNSDLTNSLINEFKQIKDDNKKLEAYLKVIATKVYKNTYNDSLVTITAVDTVSNGILKSQYLDWKVKPRKVKYYEKEVVYKLKPQFTLSAGLGVTSRIDSTARPQLEALIGFKNKKGYEFIGGYSTDKQFKFILKKDIFTKYKKPKITQQNPK